MRVSAIHTGFLHFGISWTAFDFIFGRLYIHYKPVYLGL